MHQGHRENRKRMLYTPERRGLYDSSGVDVTRKSKSSTLKGGGTIKHRIDDGIKRKSELPTLDYSI